MRKLITMNEARRRLGLTLGNYKEVYRLLAFGYIQGEIQPYGNGRRMFVCEDSLDAYIAQKDEEPGS